ncbi:spermidine/putrescine transport system permease protein [Caminicella sporogenes DSM 14501]|uniref:Spermidine/putrescine transport system permease protein n=1 Tax=Caminicella sporogenes DSM 14501 TaxID=1121266 RepID=A0A1M6S3S0_9FIRM|nr:ABC transporter permease [Caminicella sporogenes]RKD27181.1 ABC transporter permease [Caminicella sporogenes]SHK39178.1 spermidine/putrescine transport system permease protein [Caminicella sporogenes DSM 14501]
MKDKLLAYPYIVWMGLFIVVPIFLVLYFSLVTNGTSELTFTLDHFKRFFDPLYIGVLVHSINLAFISTVICLVLGYPMAFIISKVSMRFRNVMVLFFVIPMWMNFLLRTYAWMTLLERNGLINKFLRFLHFPEVNIMYTSGAVILGMVYNFLPFMVLPIYSVLVKIDKNLIETAQDLGANEFKVFLKVILPLSLPGVISGIIMVFMPAITTFVISRLLGGGQFTLIGNLIEQQFLGVYDWNFGSAISIIMMLIILLSMVILGKYSKEEGVGLW